MGRAIRILITASLLTAAATLAAVAGDVSEDILARSIDRYKAGELQPAIGGISAALRSRLTGEHLARAYLYRGLAYRKSGQPGLAITDLTRALEYSGLTDAERSEASESLQVAYQEAGISAGERVVIAPPDDEQRRAAQRKSSAPEKAAPPPASVPVTGSVEATPPSAASPPARSWQTETAAPAPAPAKAQPPESPRWATAQVALAPLPPVPAATKAAVPSSPPREPKPSVTVRSDPPAAKAVQPPDLPLWSTPKVTVAPPPVEAAPKVAMAATPPQRSQVVAMQSDPPPVVQRAPPPRPVPPFTTQVATEPAPPAPPSAVNLLVGEAHSRSEAFALAVRLTSQRGAGLGRRLPQVAETKLADDSIYRLRLGPFSDAGQALALCRSLRDSGYECMTE